MRYSSVSVFLNFIFVFFIVFGALYFHKKDAIVKKTFIQLKDTYIAKKDVKFDDLAKSEQRKYLYIGTPYEYDSGVSDSIEQNVSQRYIQELKNKLSIVQEDNLQLSNEKDKIAKTLTKMKLELIEQKKMLMSENLKQMDEAEQQHYENISELRRRINDLQRENIDLLQGENEKIILLENEIKILKQKLKGK